MSTPRIDLESLKGGDHADAGVECSVASLIEEATSGDLVLVGPVVEGLSVGEPPVMPDLTLAGQMVDPIRSVRARCNAPQVFPQYTKRRGIWTIGWTLVEHAQWPALRDFLLGDGFDQCGGTARPMTIKINGLDGSEVIVNALTRPEYESVGRRGWRVLPFEAEEVYN